MLPYCVGIALRDKSSRFCWVWFMNPAETSVLMLGKEEPM